MILSAQTLRALCFINPFTERRKSFGMTYGLGPAGYDIRLGEDVTVHCALAPHKFVLASSMERFEMPNHVMGIVHDKSTWARLGLAVQNTVIEPGWCGFLTIELSNHSEKVIGLLKGMPIAQVVFHSLDTETDMPYNGKYQNQPAGPQPAKFEKE